MNGTNDKVIPQYFTWYKYNVKHLGVYISTNVVYNNIKKLFGYIKL